MADRAASVRSRIRALEMFDAHMLSCRTACRSGIMSHQREKFCDLGKKLFNRGGMTPHSSTENAWWEGMQARIRAAVFGEKP